MKAFVVSVAGWILALGFWVWTLVKILMDWVGRSTVVDDWNQLRERMPDIVYWLYETPSWVPAMCAFAITGGTLWFMWRVQNQVTASPRVKTIGTESQTRLSRLLEREAPGQETVPASQPNDFDLILRPDNPVVARAKKTDDGIDLTVRVVVRNRSKRPLWIDIVGKFPMTFDGYESKSLSGGATRPLRPESNNPSIFGTIRSYQGINGKEGNGRISYSFGENESQANWIFDVDIDFRIVGDPNKKNADELVPLEILANRSAYRPKTDEDQ